MTLGPRSWSWQISAAFMDCKMLPEVHSGARLKYAEVRNRTAGSKCTYLIESTVLGNLVLDTQP
uniref:Uncharacterized protein n=1 Tax=Anguilla anguilla TaxID=7936 RepID=A0A0E9WTH2_ANGAN